MDQDFSIARPDLNDRAGANQVFMSSITEAFAREGLAHLHEDVQQTITQKQSMLQNYLGESNSALAFLVAKFEDTVIGTISFGPCEAEIRKCAPDIVGVGELGSLYILPEYQDQGVGSALIRSMAQQLQKREIEQFCLDSGFGRAQQRWLRKFGQPYTIAKDFWGPGLDHMVWLCNVRDYA